jgi:hypothetical protein
MTKASKDRADVLHVLSTFDTFGHGLSVRMVAGVLCWTGGTARHNLDTRRVHRALMQLAADKRIEQDRVSKRWRAVRK